ncbi:MAG: hypothetical protein IPM57_01625 [Oligoflexia bacterium]|nr:hypothetical protein [Oligoflexia bacterium]
MKLSTKLLLLIILIFIIFITLYITSPSTVSWLFSYKKSCKVLRVEPFAKGMIISNLQQVNKFSVICEDGFVCRASDTGFAGVKSGDEIVFRGFPEITSLSEFGKCENAQLLKFKTPNQ